MSTDSVCTRECCRPKTFATKRARAAHVNSLRRWYPGAPETIAAEQALAVDRITDAVNEVISTSPALRPEDIEKLVALFTSTSTAEQ